MARCLVTGHMGYIGAHLYKKLQELGHEVKGIDLKQEYPNDILVSLKEYDDGSGRFNPNFSNFKPEYIFHMACFPRVQYSIDNPIETMTNNVLSTSYVLNFARKVGAKRVIYSSSSSIIGDGSGPKSPYALQKMTSELECKLYSQLYGLDTVSLRYFNVYSPDQEAVGSYPTVASAWMKAIREGERPYITGTGEQRRDMLHVEDAVSANIFAMDHAHDFNGLHFDVGTGENISLNEIKNIVNLFRSKIEFDYVDPRPGDVLETRARISSLRKLGWNAKISIHSGIEECFNI